MRKGEGEGEEGGRYGIRRLLRGEAGGCQLEVVSWRLEIGYARDKY